MLKLKKGYLNLMLIQFAHVFADSVQVEVIGSASRITINDPEDMQLVQETLDANSEQTKTKTRQIFARYTAIEEAITKASEHLAELEAQQAKANIQTPQPTEDKSEPTPVAAKSRKAGKKQAQPSAPAISQGIS